MLPDTDGIELMGAILGLADVPVIFLSAYGREDVVAQAREMGADDYVVKPFSPTELAARIKAALRRRVASEPLEPYVLGDLTVDFAQRRVTLADQQVHLTPTEYGILAELAAHAGRVVTHEHLLGRAGQRQPAASAHDGGQAAAQAGRRRRSPHLHLHRAKGGLQDARGDDGGFQLVLLKGDGSLYGPDHLNALRLPTPPLRSAYGLSCLSPSRRFARWRSRVSSGAWSLG